MLLNYWSSSDEGSDDLEELNLGIAATSRRLTSTSSVSDIYHMLSRSRSTETIRASSRRMSPPHQRHDDLPSEYLLTSPPGLSTSKPKSKSKSSKSQNKNGGNSNAHPTTWTPSLPNWSIEDAVIKLSGDIHDGCSDLNPAFDYKYISKDDIIGHLTYQRIKLELLVSASQMAREDVEHTSDQKVNKAKTSGAPLLIRHVRSLRDLPCLRAHGDERELCVAFLTMVARKRGIGTLSVDKLGLNQTEVYIQIANQLETDMRREYDRAYGDANRKAREPRAVNDAEAYYRGDLDLRVT
ncbi:hypothetical protein C0992_009695 [Termitomyces sp. T32_za158]|nr:hypothetical protein C0992_009695 [Termitomyces sp. T32_za158]